MMEEPAAKELAPGRVTRLARQKKDPYRVSLYLDGAFAFGMHQDLILEFEIVKGIELDVETQRRIIRRDEVHRARSRAIGLLAYRARSSAELRRRLLRYDYAEESVDEAIEKIREAGLIDDAAFARDYAHARFANKGYGPARVRSELIARGVPRSAIDQAIDEAFSDHEAIAEAALAFAQKRQPSLQREADPLKRRKKLFDALRRRGFPTDVIGKVIAETLSDD